MFNRFIRNTGMVAAMFAGAGQAFSQGTTQLDLQSSADGVVWSDNTEIQLGAGETRTVLVRALVTWVGTQVPTGFASLTWQPAFGNVRHGIDSVQGFANQGNNTNGGSVVLDGTPLDGPFGRISPFASSGPSVGSAQRYQPIAHSGGSGGAPAGDYLRIARNDITRWMGTGPTSGTAAVNNFNGAGGIACVQKSQGNVGSADPAYEPRITNVAIFQIALTVGGVADGTTHIIDLLAPTDGMSRNTTTGDRQASWFSGGGDNSGSLKGTVLVDPGTITITPAPGAITLFACGVFAAARRRR